jgi:hypothetical protein
MISKNGNLGYCGFDYKDDPLQFFLILSLMTIPYFICFIYVIKSIIRIRLLLDFVLLIDEVHIFVWF